MAAPPRGRSSDRRHDRDLNIRPSWIDASIALAQLEKGRIQGGRTALWARARLQERLASLGLILHRHAGKVLFVAILLLGSFCVGLKSAQLHTRVDQLWVQEGGRLESELQYTRNVLGGSNNVNNKNEGSNNGNTGSEAATHQLAMQVSRDPLASILGPRALQAHLAALRKATAVTVYLYDATWYLQDLCQRPSIPNFEMHFIDQIFDRVIPCSIATPLDCFWEGSKLLGPEYIVKLPEDNNTTLNWTHLNPQTMVEKMKKKFNTSFSFSMLESYMKRAGISSGYQDKPCLDPSDPLCPETAPNKHSKQFLDIGAELSGGCYGFAAKYMHWPEQLIVGGGEHNKKGQLTRARALQSVVHLMTEHELYEYFRDSYRVHQIGWSQEKAAAVLDAWQRKFSEELKKIVREDKENNYYDFYAFSTVTLNDILGKYTHISIYKVAVSYVIIFIYVAVVLIQWQDFIKSQAGIGVAGVLLLSITVAAGLGFCALLGIPFNASTMQIIPFIALGISVDDMFLLTHAYAKISFDEKDPEGVEGRTSAVLRSTGLSVLQTSLSTACTFFAAALIPIPALRVFSLQAGIVLLFNLAAMLLIFPAMISLDMRRRASQRSDILCCIVPEKNSVGNSYQKSSDHDNSKRINPVTKNAHSDKMQTMNNNVKEPIQDASKQPLDPESNIQHNDNEISCISLSLSKFAKYHYAPFIMKPAVKVICILIMISVLIASLWGATKVSDGLDLTDIVPEDTDEYKFLSVQGKYFGFYSMYAVTRGDFEYPNNQKLLYDYHDAFVRIPNIIKNDNGGLPEFWLSLFRDWLKELQKAFDRDFASGKITQETWFANASDEGILAYKLLVQTGHVDNPIDKTLISQVRLVDGEGVINPKAFYNYLSAWASNDALAYGASGANLKPEPKAWFHSRDYELKIPKSLPLVYTQLPFYLHGMSDTENIKTLITSVRSLCTKFEAKGLANFPSGILFIFWEQYLHLRSSLALALVCALTAVFIIVGILLLNIWAALLVILGLAFTVLQLLGAMALLGIKLSAIPAVLLIMAVGIGVHFTIHICLSFVTSVGGRDRRTRLALEHMFAPVVHGAVTTLLAVVMLATSDFSFIARYFFSILLALIAIGFINGLLFFPILLSIAGPAAEVISLDNPDRISTPSPASSPVRVRRVAPPISHHRIRPPSLTTITEEPPSCHSSHSHHSSMQSIVVQPEVVVETTTYNTDANSGSGRSTPTVTSSVGGITTKVTAMANIKVEVHTPMINLDRCHSRRYFRERDRDRDVYHERDRDSYYDKETNHDRERDFRERNRDYRERDKEKEREGYRDCSRDRRERDRDRDREKYRESHRDGRDSGHESDSSRH